MTERPDTAALREQLRDVLNMATLRRDQSLALLDFIDSLPASRPVSPEGRWVPAAELDALAAAVNEDGGTVAAYRANVTGRAAALVRATRHMPDADVPERGWAIHEPDEFRPRLEAGETTCPEGTCAGCPDPDACAALRPAPIPATEERREDATVKLPWVVHDAVEEDWYCFATEAEAVKKAQAIIDFYGGDSWPGAIDEITVMQVTHAPVETVLFEREGMTDDEWYEATEDDGDHDMWVNYSVRPVASPSAGTVQPDPEVVVKAAFLAAADACVHSASSPTVEKLCRWAETGELSEAIARKLDGWAAGSSEGEDG